MKKRDKEILDHCAYATKFLTDAIDDLIIHLHFTDSIEDYEKIQLISVMNDIRAAKANVELIETAVKL